MPFADAPINQVGIVNTLALINGNFEIWQRSTSFAGIGATDVVYTADRWNWRGTAAGTPRVTIARDADVPTIAQAGVTPPFCLKVTCTTANPTPAANDYAFISQRIEGYSWRPFWQRPLVLSFWIKSNVPGRYSAALLSGGGDRAIVSPYSINAANTWEYKTCVFATSPSDGTWGQGNGIGAHLCFCLCSGSSYNAVAGWQSSLKLNSFGDANALDTIGNTFQLALVQLELGMGTVASATPFENVVFDENLVRCRRYFQTTFPYGTAAADATGNFMSAIYSNASSASSAVITLPWRFTTTMRQGPAFGSINIYNPRVGGTAGRITNGAVDDTGAPTLVSSAQNGVNIATFNAALAAGFWTCHATADSEL
jgi:hypothetical protein